MQLESPMQAKTALTTHVSITCGKWGPRALPAFTLQPWMFGSVAEKPEQSPASRWPWQCFCSSVARRFISYERSPSHPAALALLLSPHCAAAGPPVLAPSWRTDTGVLCKPSSTCSLSLCMVWTAQEMVLEAGDSEHSPAPTCRVFAVLRHVLLWLVSCWKANGILKMAQSFSGRLSDMVASAPHCRWANQMQWCRGCRAPDPCPTLAKTLSHVPCPAQRRCLIRSRIHWLSSALDPAALAWDWLAWEGVGYRSGETWQVAHRWKGIKPLLFAAFWFTANSFLGKEKKIMSCSRPKIWVWKIMKYFSAYRDLTIKQNQKL